jgi:membrane-associated phospholipid phosphatase
VHGLKPLFDMPRPPAVLSDVHVIGPAYRAHTFPSGHATTAFAIGGLYALGLQFRTGYVIVLSVATLAALSRAVVGVHWPLDILAGAFGGWLAACAGIELGRRTLQFGSKPWVQLSIALFLAGCALWLVIGHAKSGYPQADLFQRAVGICCLAAAGARLKRAAA